MWIMWPLNDRTIEDIKHDNGILSPLPFTITTVVQPIRVSKRQDNLFLSSVVNVDRI